jgi:hypothetical protein
MRSAYRVALRAWHAVAARCAIRDECIGRARLRYSLLYPIHVRAWYLYVAGLLREALKRNPRPACLVLGRMAAPRRGDLPVRRIDLQAEHILVKPGGRDSEGAPPGATPLPDGSGRYLVRVAGHAHLSSQDAVIEYSLCNLEHLRSSGCYPDLLARTCYIAPLLFAPNLLAGNRPRPLLTLMADVRQPRRARFLAAAAAAGLPLSNVRGAYSAAALADLFDHTRILINLRQTDSHDTLEELRVLPALLRGVIVISEDVPLRASVPYHDYIIWCRYEELVACALAVHADYAEQHRRLFGDGRLRALLAELEARNRATVQRLVERL